jgi:hypothetical protein
MSSIIDNINMENKCKSPINIFLDTSIVNNLLDLDKQKNNDSTWGKNVSFLKMLIGGPVASGDMVLYVNPSVKHQINDTNDKKRKEELLIKFDEFKFEEFNLTIFPFSFPATFVTKEQIDLIETICKEHSKLERDRKIMSDAAFNEKIDALLTTDRKLAHQVRRIGKVRFMLPEELWECYWLFR